MAENRIEFANLVKTYFNKKNPATGKMFTKTEINAALGAQEGLLAELFLIVSNENTRQVESEGRVATDAELVAAYNTVHSGEYAVATPFGLIFKKDTPVANKKVGEMDAAEFSALMQQILGK
jgi:hypothetical protein